MLSSLKEIEIKLTGSGGTIYFRDALTSTWLEQSRTLAVLRMCADLIGGLMIQELWVLSRGDGCDLRKTPWNCCNLLINKALTSNILQFFFIFNVHSS
jgi:hypothetical protein